MRTEVRFLLAIFLMVGVLVGTNLLFPPVEQPTAPAADSVATGADSTPPGEGGLPTDTPASGTTADSGEADATGRIPELPVDTSRQEEAEEVAAPEPRRGLPQDEIPVRQVTVESPIYRYTFSNRGAQLLSAELLDYISFTRDGPVQLVPDSTTGTWSNRILVGQDTLDLSELVFEVEASADRIELAEGDAPDTVRFTYRHPTQPFSYTIGYVFRPDAYRVDVFGGASGLTRGTLITELGHGLAFNEHRREDDARSMAYVGNHLRDGIDANDLNDIDERRIEEGPFFWAAIKSRYFVTVLLPGGNEVGSAGIGGLIVEPEEGDYRARISVTQGLTDRGTFQYQLYAGPLEYARLADIGQDLEEVNPYGWRFFRPIIRPFVGVILWILRFLHENLSLGYGWVLMVFGVALRVLLWPLNQKAMRAQMNNMEVQPLVKQIQEKYKDNPEKLQKEMMKLYKEHGFNPLAGCLPLLLPWPILIALFFVFQNTIELRGVSFLWFPDLSAPDPLYILPVILAISMFLMQYISVSSMKEVQPQMKMMMWLMPIFFGFIFFTLPAGLNLYYATANVASLPQQLMIARERRARHDKPTPTLD